MPALDWTPLHARLHQTLRQRKLVQRSDRLLVAVSGGQDSLCLARLLLDLQPKWDWQVAIAHCDHRWRSDSAANAAYVLGLASGWGIPATCLRAETIPSREAEARQWRYQVLTQTAEQQGYSIVVTGHTASDRAETLLYNLIRGSGSDGLQALTWIRPLSATVHLVRPILDFTRQDTANYCHQQGLQVWQDATNDEWHYARNRIRQAVLPYLATHFNPQVEQHLAQTAEVLRAEVDYLQTITHTLGQQIHSTGQKLSDGDRRPKLHRPSLQQIHLALQRRLLRDWLHQILGISPNFNQVEKLVALISAPNRSQTDPFPGGAIAQVQGDWLVLLNLPPECSARRGE